MLAFKVLQCPLDDLPACIPGGAFLSSLCVSLACLTPTRPAGLERMDLTPPVRLSPTDWHDITSKGRLCNEEGELTRAGWHRVCHSQLSLHVNQLLVESLAVVQVLISKEPCKRAL